MINTKILSKSDFIHLCVYYPVVKKYYLLNLWSEDFREYDKIKYCESYMSKYVGRYTQDFLRSYFSLPFILIIQKSPFFVKFTKSGFIKYVDVHFFVFFQDNFFLVYGRSSKDIENFVHKYFQRYIRRRFDEDLLFCLLKSINEFVPNSLQKSLIGSIEEYYLGLILGKSNKIDTYRCTSDNKIFFSSGCTSSVKCLAFKNKSLGLSERVYFLSVIFNRKCYKSSNILQKKLYFMYLGLPLITFLTYGEFRKSYTVINNVFKKSILFYRIKFWLKKENNVTKMYNMKFKFSTGNGTYSLSFLGFHGLYLRLCSTKMGVSVVDLSHNIKHQNFNCLFEVGVKGLDEFNYKQYDIQLPVNVSSFCKKDIKITTVSSKALKDLLIYLNNHCIKYGNKRLLDFHNKSKKYLSGELVS